MNWFANFSSALKSQNGQPSQPSQTGSAPNQNQSGQPNQTSQTHVFDSKGQPIENQPQQPQNQNPNQSNQNPNQSDQNQTKSIEDLLFSEPESQPQKQNQNQTPDPNAPAEIAPGLTPETLINNLKAVNLAQTLPSETLQAALSGDTTAFSQIINQVAQLSAAVAIQQSTGIAKSLIDKSKSEWESSLPSKLNDNQFSSITAKSEYSNPFVRPMVENIISQMRKRDPSITPQQVESALPRLLQHALNTASSNLNQNQPNQSNQNQPNQSNQNLFRTAPEAINYDDLF